MYKPTHLRVLEKLDLSDPGGCWLWLGALSGGYGSMRTDTVKFYAHRWVYEQLVGEIPTGMFLDHLCRVRNCVNPHHLQQTSNKENILRGESPPAKNARKTHCVNDHRFTPENTKVRTDGSRRCLACSTNYKRKVAA